MRLILFRKYGESWKISVMTEYIKDAQLGMNTIANWSDKNIYLQDRTHMY